ncbi:MAG: hypothetical protein IPK13_01020 [Deltaproteobacteria bacterium]|nr:hypothetical protein [Deltaproteobacteria bacterium]
MPSGPIRGEGALVFDEQIGVRGPRIPTRAYRVSVPPGAARWLLPSGVPLTKAAIMDVSATGVRFSLDAGYLDVAAGRPLVCDFGPAGQFETRLSVARTEGLGDGRVLVGASFSRVTRSSSATLSRFILERVLSDAEISPWFEQCRRFAEKTTDISRGEIVYGDQAAIEAKLSRAFVERKGTLVGSVWPEGQWPQSSRIVVSSSGDDWVSEGLWGSTDLAIDNGVVEVALGVAPCPVFFRTMARRGADGRLRLAFPDCLREFGFRSSRRASVEASVPLSLRASHPHLPQAGVSKAVLEISAGGLAFELLPEKDVLFPHDVFDRVEIDLPDQSIRATGVLRNVFTSSEGRVKCGVELIDFETSADRLAWREYVFGAIYPSIDIVRGDEVNRGWEALGEAEYADRWTLTAQEARRRQAYHSAWSKVSPLDGYTLVMSNEGLKEGTVAANSMYPRTWLLHQLGIHCARRTKEQRPRFFEIAREIYTTLAYIAQHLAEADYFVLYVEAHSRWTRLLFDDFVERYSDKDAFVFTCREVFRCFPSDAIVAALRPTKGVTVRPAAADELTKLSDHLRVTLSPLEYDAFSYGPDEIDLSGFSRECEERQYRRHRTIYVAAVEGQVVSAAIAESADEGISVFGLLNIAWICDLSRGPWTEEARAALLSQLIRHYHQLDVQLFVYSEPDDEWRTLNESLGLQYVSAGTRWIARRSVAAAWQNHLETTLEAHRLMRRMQAPTAASAEC